MSRGVLFITTGAHFTKAAAEAARSVRASNPGLKLGIFTNVEADPIFDFTGPITSGAARCKHEYLAKSPFEETLYLDSDTRVTANLDDFFRVLGRFDMAGASVRYRSSPRRLKKWRLELPLAFPQINCGVLLYRLNEKTLEFFENWVAAIETGGFQRDQVPFREVLWLSDIRFHTVGPEYNTRSINISPLPSKLPLPLILHIKALHSESKLKRFAAQILLCPMKFRLRRAGHII